MKQTKLVGASLLSMLIASVAVPAAAQTAPSESKPGAQPSTTQVQPGDAQGTTANPSMQAPAAGSSTDATITSAVNAEIAKDPQMKAAHVKVSTMQGRVALTGTAPSPEMRTRIEQAATAVQGVTGVDNKLTVSSKS